MTMRMRTTKWGGKGRATKHFVCLFLQYFLLFSVVGRLLQQRNKLDLDGVVTRDSHSMHRKLTAAVQTASPVH